MADLWGRQTSSDPTIFGVRNDSGCWVEDIDRKIVYRLFSLVNVEVGFERGGFLSERSRLPPLLTIWLTVQTGVPSSPTTETQNHIFFNVRPGGGRSKTYRPPQGHLTLVRGGGDVVVFSPTPKTFHFSDPQREVTATPHAVASTLLCLCPSGISLDVSFAILSGQISS